VSKQHLPIERLADLADGDPMPEEREHLVACATCAGELLTYRRLIGLAEQERRRIAPPLTTWEDLSAELRREGLLRTTAELPAIERQPRFAPFARRAAAVALLLGSGAVMGRMSAGMTAQQALTWSPGRVVADSSGSSTFVSAEDFADNTTALTALTRAQREYERAAQYLAAHDTASTEAAAEQYRLRLAALDQMTSISREAISVQPADPILNQVYYSTLGMREATLQKLGTALPVGARLTRF
jgi:hypothetical protein